MDFTMCDGGRCPLRKSCRRFLATPNDYQQPYYIEPPYVMTKDSTICNKYWKEDKYEDKKILD
jgi:hypothetical protein